MIEKRFEYNHEKGYKDYIYDVVDNRMMWDLECICELLNSLNDENEQLKQTIKEVYKLLEEEVDLFSDKATEHDINAYIELRELDNKDAYYMATATKKAIKILKGDVK